MTNTPQSSRNPPVPTPWRSALPHALPLAGFMLALFYYWYAVADRYRVFLYNHDMGPLYPDTSPFSAVTSSRYWMAGLVAGGAAMLLYAAVNWLLARLSTRYRPPALSRVWVLSALPLFFGIPAITMTANQPTLPLANAAQITLVTLTGLPFALAPGRMAMRRPADLAWLALDGWMLALILSTAIGLERAGRWLAGGAAWRVWMMIAAMLAGLVGLLFITALRAWRRAPVPRATAVFAAGLCEAYLLLPLLHHVIGTDGYYYITDSDNFFARNGPLQLAIWVVTAALVQGLTRIRQALAARTAG